MIFPYKLHLANKRERPQNSLDSYSFFIHFLVVHQYVLPQICTRHPVRKNPFTNFETHRKGTNKTKYVLTLKTEFETKFKNIKH